jgi:hypothetical protein
MKRSRNQENGMLEEWKDGIMGIQQPSFYHPNIPVFHFSIIPFPLAFPYFLCVLCGLCGERFLGEKT